MKNIQKLKYIIFFISAVGGFLAMLDSDTINLALYSIAKDLNVDFSSAQWIVTVYILVVVTFLTLFGKLSDLFPRKKLYSLGYLLFALGALLNTFAFGFIPIICTRILQALGASVLLANNHAIVSSVFKGKKRAQMLGFSTAIMALAGLSGPVLGGFFIHFFNWRYIFLPSVVIGFIGALLSLKYIPSTHKKKIFHFDFTGMFYMLIVNISLLLLISKTYVWGWSSDVVKALIVILLIFVLLFYYREKNFEFPIFNLSLFRSKIFVSSNFALMIAYFSSYTNVLLLPYYVQKILALPVLKTAFLLLPFSFMSMTAALLNGKMVKKAESSHLMMLGMLLTVTGFLLLFFISSTPNYYILILSQCLIGAGAGCYHPNVNNLILSNAPKTKLGIVSGIIAMFRNVGKLLGITISVSIFTFVQNLELSKEADTLTSFIIGYKVAIIAAIIFGLISLLLSYTAHCAYMQRKNERAKISS